MFRYYLIVMFGGMALLSATAVLLGGLSPLFSLLGVVGSTVAVFLLDALVAILVRKLPAEKMDPFCRLFAVHHWERKFYVRIGIRRWKDKIPETGGLLVNFSKKKVADRSDNAYLMKFMQETCYAELMHTLSIPTGFLILFLFPKHILYFGLPVALVNAVLQLLPVFVQRYVRPFLLSCYRRNQNVARNKASSSA